MAPTAPVLAVLVCHDGETWLPESLGALGRLSVGPRRVIAVDTGSRDSTPDLLRSSNRVDVVLDLPRDTPFGTAVAAAVADADRRWGRSGDRSSGDWLWVLHDDAAPEPACLDVLLSVAESSPAAAVLGPLQLDWDDPRLVVEAGLSTDASGHRQTGIGSDELDLGQFATNSEVLAVGSAGALVRRREWDALGGYDSAYGLLREDVDLGWRVNRAGGLVLCVPSARLRHARAVTTGVRPPDAAGTDGGLRAVDRRNGMWTLLANTSGPGFALGLARLPVLAVLRAIGFLLLRRPREANAELGAMGRVVADLADLREARRRRTVSGTGDPRAVRGLLTSRTTRLRNAVSGGLAGIVRARVRDDLDLGRLPEWADRPDRGSRSAAGGADGPEEGSLLVGQGALPAGVTAPKRETRRKAGLRRPGGDSVAVSLAEPGTGTGEAGPTELLGTGGGRHRGAEDPEAPTALVGIPAPRAGAAGAAAREPDPGLVVVPITPARVLRELLLAPPLLLVLALTAVSLVVNRSRLGLDLAGGRLRAMPKLGTLWSSYLAEWHPVAGGTAAPASAATAVLGVLGAVLWPVAGSDGPGVAVSLLLLGALPLAGLSAYLASRPLRVGRVLRALSAGVYALLGIAGAAVAQGRLDGVVAVIGLPLVLAGVAAVLRGSPEDPGDGRGRRGSWWSAAAGTVLLLAVVSAFAPLVHLLVLVVVVVGFVLVPAPAGTATRRTVALAVVVVLPVLLLLPWPSVLLRAPQVLLHGTGSPVTEQFTGTFDVLSLDPGGPGSLPVVGLLLLVAAMGGALLAPRSAVVPGLAVTLLGVVAAGLVGTLALPPVSGGDPRPGWTGPALAFAACGALWSLLALVAEARVVPLGTLVTGRSGPRHRPAAKRRGDSAIDLGPDGVLSRVGGGARSAVSGLGTALGSRLHRRAGAPGGRARGIAVPVVAAAAVALAVCSALLGGGGALAERPAPTLDPELAGRLAASGATVADVGLARLPDGPGYALDTDATRRSPADLPRYGDDDLVPVGAAPARLARDVTALLSGEPATVQAGAAELASSGTAAVVLPDPAVAERARAAAAPLLVPAAPTSDGRPVLTIDLPAAGAVILEPPVSDDATDAKAAPRRPDGITPLPAAPPRVGVLISPGADRRVVVVAAERESGWTATVGGAPADVLPAWGHLVGVSVPAGGGPVVVERDGTLRGLLLLLQLALVLFTVLSALPSRTRLR